MGIREDVLSLLHKIGMGTMATKPYPLYPDLVRQFLSTCSVYYTNERAKVAQEGTLTFMCHGTRYRISIPDLCGLYGFKKEPKGAVLSSEWHDVRTFWAHIGNGVYETRDSKQTDVRHPVLRYVLRTLGNTILCKAEPNKMRKTELILLYRGIQDMFPDDIWEFWEHDTPLNMGAVFANHLCTLKTKAFGGKKVETIGSLLTPIFRYFEVIGARTGVNTDCLFMDQAHLRNATWMRPGLNWIFTDSEGSEWSIKLPQPALTTITEDAACLSFEPRPALLRAVTRRKLRKGASSSAAPTADEDEMVDYPAEDPLPDADAPFPDLQFPEPPAGYRDDGPAFREYMVSTLRKMWGVMAAAVTCRGPSQSRRRRRSPTPDPTATAAAYEDVPDSESDDF